MTPRRIPVVFTCVAWILGTPIIAFGGQADDPVSAKTWIGIEPEIEEFLRTAEILGLTDIPVGVTNPRSANLEPGGPVNRFAWKPVQPGIQRGHYESYKAEIAAYELDKLLGLGMVPVKVERRIRGELGAAIMWVSPTQSFKDLGGLPTPPNRYLGYWTIQLIRAKMFDNLIYNRDPNEGNWLTDPAWNIFLIDHTRSFTPDLEMAHDDMIRVDRYLWQRMQRLDEPILTETLGEWLSEREIRAILERRDRMGEVVDELVAKSGEAAVLIRYGLPPGSEAPAPRAEVPGADFVNSPLVAANEARIIALASELTWMGTVVTLDDYDGPFGHIAAAGLRDGHTLGLVAGSEGLLCLTASSDEAPYRQLDAWVGDEVEIFGVLADGTETPLVRVTVARVQ